MSNIIRFIGDIHGKHEPYKRLIRCGYPSIQVGDMGIGFRRTEGYRAGEFFSNPPHYAMVENKARFLRGNHDNPAECKKHSQWIPDGTVEGNIMYIGGAVSIDKAWRREGYTYWIDEECSMEELYGFVDTYVNVRPDIMVTHECPQEVAETMELISRRGKLNPEWSSRSRQAFQSMWSCHSPRLWIYGHWHRSFDYVLRGTRFVCLNELEYKDIDTENLTMDV